MIDLSRDDWPLYCKWCKGNGMTACTSGCRGLSAMIDLGKNIDQLYEKAEDVMRADWERHTGRKWPEIIVKRSWWKFW